MLTVKSFDNMVKNSYFFCAGSENIEIPRSPNLGRRDINLFSESEHFTSPVIAGKNSVLITSPNCVSYFLLFGIILMKCIGLCLILWRNQCILLGVHTTLYYTINATPSPIGPFFLEHFLLECFRPNTRI